MIETVLRGGMIGFAIAAPVGPIGLLCIKRTLESGPATGVMTGLGAASADAIYGLVVALGFGVLASVLLGYTAYLQISGGVLLLILGLTPMLKKTANKPAQLRDSIGEKRGGQIIAFGSTFALTLTNPLTIISFIGAIAALSGTSELSNSAASGLAVVIGVFLGSVTWWLMLVGLVMAVRTSISSNLQKTIGNLSSLLLVGFGLYAIYLGSKGLS